MSSDSRDFEKLRNYIKDLKFAMLTTVSPDGKLHSRPMGMLDLSDYNFECDGTIWFFSKKNSFKNDDIKMNQNVNLAYSNPSQHRYVSFTGQAKISRDKEKMRELWNPILKAWFPEGLEDAEVTLIGVIVESAEIWDAPPSKVVQLAGFLKSTLAGRPYEEKAHSKHLDLEH
jgi:general stress protein 26